MRNMASLLLLSGGVPMILAGDEMARTQGGNNNAYCQDNATSWVDWTLTESNSEMVAFFRRMISFRASRDAFRHIDWGAQAGEPHTRVTFHGVFPHAPDWGPDSHALAIELEWGSERIYFIANSFWENLRFQLPLLTDTRRWTLVEDTNRDGPRGPNLDSQVWYDATPRSVVVLEAL